MNTELLYLKFDKKQEDGSIVLGAAFPSDNEQIILGTYTYEAKRMGGAPTITTTFNFPRCLDKEWRQEGCSDVYVEYNGDKFFISSIPTTTKDDTSNLYKHEITLVSHREILDNTLFFDVVTEHTDTLDKDRYRSNQTKFSFSGTIQEFIKRINDSLIYVGIYDPTKNKGEQGYHLEINDGYGTDDIKEVSIESQYITEVIQEIYNTFNLAYYWKGEVCYVGEYENDLSAEDNIVEYGRNNQLISVSKENTNSKIIDTITGYGSSDNIPYYYPNDDEFGEAIFETENVNKKQVAVELSKIIKSLGNNNCYNNKLYLYKILDKKETRQSVGYTDFPVTSTGGNTGHGDEATITITETSELYIEAETGTKIDFTSLSVVAKYKGSGPYGEYNLVKSQEPIKLSITYTNKTTGDKGVLVTDVTIGTTALLEIITPGIYAFSIKYELTYLSSSYRVRNDRGSITIVYAGKKDFDITKSGGVTIIYAPTISDICFKDSVNKRFYTKDELGITLPNIEDINYKEVEYVLQDRYDEKLDHKIYFTTLKEISSNVTNQTSIVVTGRRWFEPSQNLMPSIYRNTQGAERFYYATDTPPVGYEDIYKIPGTDKNYTFKNKYVKGIPHQGSISFDDIKPTINGVRNDVIQEDGLGQLFGEIADVAFDSADNDVKDTDGNYEHQYFYIKLHKFSGEFGFDLFNHALASENAVINMIDCQGCPACAFPIKAVWNAEKNKCFNCVNTDDNGNLVSLKTEKDDYILSDDAAIADKLNQNSQEKEIWIAVQKETSTLGIVMPNAAGNFKPKKGDKFVITGIRPPKVLTTAAEDRLDKALIKYMSENNEDQFNYVIKFSRIFLVENKKYADKLNENAKICVKFNGVKQELFVSNYSIKRDKDILVEIEIELVKSLEITQSEIKQMVESAKGDIQNNLSGLNTGSNSSFNAAVADKLYISKLKDDTTEGLITFLKGIIAKGRIDAYNGFNLGRDGEHYLDGAGNGILGDVVVDRIHDKNSTPAERVIIGAQGFDLYMGTDGKSHLYVDYLTTRTKMFASSLEIRKVSYSGGTTIFSNAGSEICKVAYIFSEDAEKVIAYKCYSVADDGTTKTMNWWHIGMMALCQTFNVKAGETQNAANRYYWRMVVGVGQEKLEDGKLYDYVILSNQRVFQGNAAVIPSYTQGVFGNNGKLLSFGNIMVQVTNDNGMKTMAQLFMEQEGRSEDDGGTAIASRLFYGYESVDGGTESEPDAPQPWDVIVQVGDEIQWKKYGNLIKLSTSVEDSATENAPAITMYHNLGAPYSTGSKDDNGNDIVNPFQWKTITTIISPEKVMHNTDNFVLFQGTPDNIVDPIVVSYEIIASTNYITRHPSTETTTPTDITFRLRKRTGNKTEWIDDAKIYADYTDSQGVSRVNVLLTNKKLSDLGSVYGIMSCQLHTTIKVQDQADEVVTYDVPVLTDGKQGEQGIPGSNGTPGAPGKDGVGIKSADVIYCVADSETVAPADNADWKTLFSQLSLVPSKYVWSCTKITLTNGTAIYSGKQCLGKCEDFTTITEQYALGDSQTSAPTSGWGTTYEATKEKWLWTRSEMSWSNGNKTYASAICIGYFSKDGANGKNGSYTDYLFGLSAQKTTSNSSVAPADVTSWTTTAPVPTESKPYVWMQIKKVENDKVTSTSYARVSGEDGKDGKSGAYTVYDYNISKQNVNYATASFYYSSWQDAPMAVTEEYPFLWMRMSRKNDPNDSSITYVCLTGAKGEKGDKGDQGIQGLQGIQGEKGEQGIQGTKGADGSTTYFHIKYSSVANPTSASQMTETPSEYIGTYVDFEQADSNDPKKYNWARFQGLQGEQGLQGIPGTNGADGKTSYLHIKYSDDGGKTFTSNSGETVGAYIGTCVDYNVDDPTSVSAYTWAKIKGADGSDGVGIVSIEEHYQVSSSNTTAPTTWQSSVPVMTETNKYLWNYETIHYTDGKTEDSNKRVIGVYGDSGVGIKSVTNYYLATSASSGVSTSTSGWTTTIQTISTSQKYLWNYEVIEYTNNTKTTTIPCIIGSYGKDGVDGTDGEDAINISVVGAPMVFDTADDGVVAEGDTKTAKIYVYQKGVNQTAKVKNISLLSNNCVNLTGNKADVTNYTNEIWVTIKGSYIAKDALTVGGTTDYVSKASGYAVVQFSFNGVMYQRQIVFNVNVARYTHTMKQTSKELESKYTEVSKNVSSLTEDLKQTNDMAQRTDEDYRQFESTFVQNSRQIALGVTSQIVGRNNLLINSDFRTQEGIDLNYSGIEINTGYQGMNCVHAVSANNTQYSGILWQGGGNSHNVPITTGKEYTFSCWVKCSSQVAEISLSMSYRASLNGTDGDYIPTKDNASKLFKVKAVNEWELINVTFIPTDSKYPYAAVTVWVNARTDKNVDAYFCMPMLEESSTYNPWTLHPQDNNFVGGNMLDNTRFLQRGTVGNMYIYNSTNVTIQSYESGTQVKYTDVFGSALVSFFRLKFPTTGFVEANRDYIFSFLGRGNVNLIAKISLEAKKTYSILIEDSNGNISTISTTPASSSLSKLAEFSLKLNTYERYWLHFRFEGDIPQYIGLFASAKGDVYFAQPKLEASCRMTEWTERKSDFVDENRLRKTGINIEDGTITLDADNTIISGDLHLKGVLVENTSEVEISSTAEYIAPIVCDLVANKSVSIQTDCALATGIGGRQRQVLLPMYYDVQVDRYKSGTKTVKALQESGVKLTIMSKYNPYVAKWKNAPRHLMLDSYKIPSQGYSFQGIVSEYIVAIFADPRLARYSNYKNGICNITPTGMQYKYTEYTDGCFVCNGRRGRVLLLMPGQSVNLTSAVETLNGKKILVWYVDNSSEFVGINRKVRFGTEDDDSNSYTDVQYDQTSYEYFPEEVTEAHYQDALFAPPELDWDYPQNSSTGKTQRTDLPIYIYTN